MADSSLLAPARPALSGGVLLGREGPTLASPVRLSEKSRADESKSAFTFRRARPREARFHALQRAEVPAASTTTSGFSLRVFTSAVAELLVPPSRRLTYSSTLTAAPSHLPEVILVLGPSDFLFECGLHSEQRWSQGHKIVHTVALASAGGLHCEETVFFPSGRQTRPCSIGPERRGCCFGLASDQLHLRMLPMLSPAYFLSLCGCSSTVVVGPFSTPRVVITFAKDESKIVTTTTSSKHISLNVST